jgi:hypothetical protein
MGTEVLREHFHKDIWIDSLEYRMRKVVKQEPCVVISDARFTNELDLIKSLGGAVINVRRGELPQWYDTAVEANQGNVPAQHKMMTQHKSVHLSEWNWIGYDFDYVIDNDSDLEHLKNKVQEIHLLINPNQ